MMHFLRFAPACSAALLLACADTPATPAFEAISLLGDTLRHSRQDSATQARWEAQLDTARGAFERSPDDLDSIIWYGRRAGYLTRYREAIRIYSDALAARPDEPRLLRHRGHRWISVREFAHAVADLERAATLIEGMPDRIEEDGLPNPAGIPTGTLRTSILYHLGLAHYLRGDFAAALPVHEAGLAASGNPDMATAFRYWLVLTARRLGDSALVAATLADVDPDVELLENVTYHRLLLHFRGMLPADSLVGTDSLGTIDNVTAGYGVAAWLLLEGREAGADSLFRQVVAAGNAWPGFGFIAAEAELAR